MFGKTYVIVKYSNISEVYSDPRQTSKIKLFAKIVNAFHPFTIYAKSSILDV